MNGFSTERTYRMIWVVYFLWFTLRLQVVSVFIIFFNSFWFEFFFSHYCLLAFSVSMPNVMIAICFNRSLVSSELTKNTTLLIASNDTMTFLFRRHSHSMFFFVCFSYIAVVLKHMGDIIGHKYLRYGMASHRILRQQLLPTRFKFVNCHKDVAEEQRHQDLCCVEWDHCVHRVGWVEKLEIF